MLNCVPNFLNEIENQIEIFHFIRQMVRKLLHVCPFVQQKSTFVMDNEMMLECLNGERRKKEMKRTKLSLKANSSNSRLILLLLCLFSKVCGGRSYWRWNVLSTLFYRLSFVMMFLKRRKNKIKSQCSMKKCCPSKNIQIEKMYLSCSPFIFIKKMSRYFPMGHVVAEYEIEAAWNGRRLKIIQVAKRRKKFQFL